ncbi:EamA family transporter [Streptomyces sp. NPDC097107]|uniref:EamA family transporter n=1 Tax=Streptomyces sp. NPDC097107 TaxID=3366089 RepID=UPI00380355A5
MACDGRPRRRRVLLLLPAAPRHPGRLRLPPRRAAEALLIGAGAALGLILYLLAAQRQPLSVAVVLASRYPALPVVLGLALLHERVDRRQAVGPIGAAAATVLLTPGRAPGPRVWRTPPPHARTRAAGRGGRGWAPVRVRPTAQPHVAE